jgi:penicillin amidase
MSLSSRDTRMVRILKWVSFGVAALVSLLALAAVALYFSIRASRPALDGDIGLPNLRESVSVTRDAHGTVAIDAKSAVDAIRALGFVHAQERFFEMDLARRSAAGELSALLGAATLPMDRDKRRHRMRARAVAEWGRAPEIERAWFTAYTEGVNAGLNTLGIRPWQYLVLRAEPAPWKAEDSLLVLSEMYFMLQSGGFESRYADIRLRQQLGDALFDWLRPAGGPWDATLDGVSVPAPAMPGPEVLDTRAAKLPPVQRADAAGDAEQILGSNNWAVGGGRTADGRAILANDMHLGLNVPGIWFRAQLQFVHDGNKRVIAGVTLPGIPQVAAGSNGEVAWGFTNSYGQWFDWVEVPKSAEADSPLAVRTVNEEIVVARAPSETLTVRETAIGPVLKSDAQTDYALAWVGYRQGALMNRAPSMMLVRSLDEALALAREIPIPHQNLMLADKAGNTAWTIVGRFPERPVWGAKRGVATPLDALPAQDRWLDPAKVPVVKTPQDGLLWSANSRQLGGKGSEIIGDGGFDLGARSTQIRDRLREKPQHDEKSLYAIQLDSESRFLKPWAALALARGEAPSTPPPIVAVLSVIKRWNGKADIDQSGHRVTRAFRERMLNELWRGWLVARGVNVADGAEKSDARLSYDGRFEYAAWQAIKAEAPHLLPTGYHSWPQFIDAQLVWVHNDIIKQAGTLDSATWGARNTTRIKHPFSRAMPFLAPYLDMPPRPQAGDNHMPRVAAPGFGASQRLVVSPGREADGILTVAGGQSGHPLSPFYGAGHREWLEGVAQPLLAGQTRHTLRLSSSL